MSAPTFAQRFGRAMKAARGCRGLSQEQLAEAGGFHRTYPSLIERGLREPKLSTFIRLCEAAGVSPVQVLNTLLTHPERGIDDTESANEPCQPP